MLCREAKKEAKAEKAAGRAAKKAGGKGVGGVNRRVHMAMPSLRGLGGRGRERNSLKNRRLFSTAPGGLRVSAALRRQVGVCPSRDHDFIIGLHNEL